MRERYEGQAKRKHEEMEQSELEDGKQATDGVAKTSATHLETPMALKGAVLLVNNIPVKATKAKITVGLQGVWTIDCLL